MKLVAEASIIINASPKKVWQALTTPSLIKQYLMDTQVNTTWLEGSAINYRGIYHGKRYHDRGIIKKIRPNKLLQSTYLSSMSGKEDKSENYNLITYRLKKTDDNKTMLTLSQDNNATEQEKKQATQNWKSVLKKLKTVVESQNK
ncbi:MAG TPA: SRPBCC family protein [Bacteroidia bacterium]|jgi:uncharacterized protein YndB with AHSA1/START domain|nr:SRPBCC family protein [Bacteroidia bacterium]